MDVFKLIPVPAAQHLPRVPCTSPSPFSLLHLTGQDTILLLTAGRQRISITAIPFYLLLKQIATTVLVLTLVQGPTLHVTLRQGRSLTLLSGSWAHHQFYSLPTCNDTWYKTQQ